MGLSVLDACQDSFDRCDRPWPGLFAIVVGCMYSVVYTAALFLLGSESGDADSVEGLGGENPVCYVSVWSRRYIFVENNQQCLFQDSARKGLKVNQ